LRSSLFWLLACRVLLNQPNRSRTGSLERVQAAALGLAEVSGEKNQGEHDEQREHRAPPPDRLVIHE
jgi:hypothetical protein